MTSYMASEVSNLEKILPPPISVRFSLSKSGTRVKNIVHLEDITIRPRPQIVPNLECIPH